MRITSESGVQDRVLTPGSYFSNDVEVRHEGVNIGQTTLRYLIVEKKYADTRPASAVAPGLCAQRYGSPASSPASLL